MLRFGRIPFLSKPLALMVFKDEFPLKFAANAVISSTSPSLLENFHGFDVPYPWYRREQKGLYLKCRRGFDSSSSSSSSPPPPPPPPPSSLSSAILRISSNRLPSLSSSKPPSSNFMLLPFTWKPCSSFRNIEGTYSKDLPSRQKATKDIAASKVQSTPIYRHVLLNPPVRVQTLRSRGLHNSCTVMRRSKSNSGEDCKSVKEICRSKKDVCSDTESCKERDAECYPERVKCEPQKTVRKDMEDKQVCPKSCIRGGKCIIAASKKPAKMVYGSTECPPPKLISPRTCPRSSSNEYTSDEPVSTEKTASRKLRMDACVPPPLPGPPTDPVPLCPCPPPPKLHPGPCPCPAYKEELKIKPSPPCPVKDKYPCCLPTYYCPPKKPCVRKLPCDKMKKKKC